MEVLTGLGVVSDRLVPGNKAHVADLALANVAKGAIRFPPIVVAVLLSALSREEEDERVVFRGADPALPLATKAVMEIAPSGRCVLART